MKWVIILLCLLPLTEAYILNNQEYIMSVGIVSGANLSNENYNANVNIYPLQAELSNSNYKLNLGYLFSVPALPVPELSENVGGGGSGKSYISTPYYDIILEGINPSYSVYDMIYVNITLINKGDVPDRDAILTYYLSSPNGTRYSESREIFEEVQPSCPYMEYDLITDKCISPSNEITEPARTILDRNFILPSNPALGEWRFYAEYQTEVQPLIRVYKSFQVNKPSNAKLILLALFALLLFLIIKIQREKYE